MSRFMIRTHSKNLGRIRKMRPALDFYSENGYLWIMGLSKERLNGIKEKVDILEIKRHEAICI